VLHARACMPRLLDCHVEEGVWWSPFLAGKSNFSREMQKILNLFSDFANNQLCVESVLLWDSDLIATINTVILPSTS